MSANNQAAALNESFVLKAVIGGVSCSTATFVLNPLEVARIRMQNQSKVAVTSGVQYTSMRQTLQRIFAEEGARGLMRGVVPSVCRGMFYSSLRIGWYEPIRKMLVPAGADPTQTSPLIKYVASLLSGALASAIANPFDLVKTRMQAILPNQPPPYRNMFHALRSIAAEQGIAGLYKGWTVTSSRAAVMTSAQIGTYDSVKRNIMMDVFHLEDGFALHLGSSMVAGLVTTTATNPFDVVKTRYLSDREGRYASIVDCVAQTLRHDGVRGFFKGWTPSYWRIGPHTVISLLLIEKLRDFAGLGAM